MPYKKKTFTRRAYRRPNVGRRPTYGRRPMNRFRRNQNLSRNTMWFKKVGDLTAASPAGVINGRYTTNDSFPIPTFVNVCRNWEQYKVLKVITKFYPAYIGSESVTSAAAGYRRGNVVTWIDQPPLDSQNPATGQITILMGFPSCKLHQPSRVFKRWMNRPRGAVTNEWSQIHHPTALGVPTIDPDNWKSEIRLFGDGFSVNPTTQKPYFFVEMWFKVTFRSKYRGGPAMP